MSIKKKILFTICLVVFLTGIGMCVYLFKSYYNTEDGKTKIYKEELKDKLNLQGNKTVIKIIKEDINADNIEDYVVLLGEEKYEDNDTTKNNDIKKIFSNVEMYNNISVDFIEGSSGESKRFDTKKAFGTDVTVSTSSDKDTKYVVISDKSTGNFSLIYLKNSEIRGVIADSIKGDLCGYTISAEFKKDDESKLVVKLDNFGRDYLGEKEETILDYSDTNVNKDNYRATYMANRFCEYNLSMDENGNLEIEGIQNILYSNKEGLEKTVGKVVTKFKVSDEKKLVFKQVEVIK